MERNLQTIINQYKSTLLSTLEQSYQNACDKLNYYDALNLALKIRDKKLEETDKYIAIDNLSIDSSSIDALLQSFQALSNNPWIKYRAELRNIENQEGFPFNIQFPIPPKK